MACKPYNVLYKEARDYITSEEEFKELFDTIKNMKYDERADAYLENKMNVVDGINAARPWLDNQRIELTDIINKGEGKYSINYRYLTSPKIYSKTVGEYRLSMGEEGKTFDVLVKDLHTLYSDMDYVNEGRIGYETTVVDMIHDSGKIVDLAKELVELDSVKAKNEDDLLAKVGELSKYLKEQVSEVTVHLNKEAERNHGWIPMSNDKVEVFTAVGPGNKYKSALEVYAHELYHAITRFALESKDPVLANVMRELKAIKNQFLDEVTEDRLAAYFDGDKAEAKKILDYFAKEGVGTHEFVSFAMTNHAVIDILKGMTRRVKEEEHPDFAAKVASLFRKVMDRLVSIIKKPNKSKNNYSDMVNLVDALAKANNRQLEAKRSMVLEKMFGLLDKGDEKLSGYIKKLKGKAEDMDMPKRGNMGVLSDAAYLLKLSARALVDEKAKRVVELTAGLAGLKPEGTAQTIIRDMSKGDLYQDLIERQGMVSQNIDQHREFTFTQIALELKNAFKDKLSEQESEALSDVVLDTDVDAIWGDYDLKELLEDSGKLDSAVKSLDAKLRSEVGVKDYRYYREQYRGLGYYMVTGKASMIQLLNARNIAEKSNHPTGRKTEVNENVVHMIDQLATLEALKHVNPDSKATMAALIGKDKEGVDTFIAYHSAFKSTSEEKLFNTEADKRKIIKGYSKELFDQDVDLQTAPTADEGKMRQMGYKKVEDLTKHKNDGSAVPMSMYVSNGKVVQNLHRVAMRYTDKGRRGTSIRDSYSGSGSKFAMQRAKRDIAQMNVEAAKKILAIENGEKNVITNADYGIAPILSNGGDVTDYRYMMSRDKKKEVLGMDRRAINVLARMYASTYDKEKSELFNKELLGILDEDAKANYIEGSRIGRNQKEYVVVNKNSTDPDIRDIWSVMPDSVKKSHPEGLPMRRDTMHSILGYRELSIVDFPVFKDMPEIAKHALRVAESVWKEIIKITKIDIILKTPAVLTGNIISNFMYSVMNGEMPHKIAALQLQGIRELNEYLAKAKEIIRLEAKKATGRTTETENRRIQALKNDINMSSVKDLIDEGFYTSILEEIGVEEFGHEKGRLHKFISETKSKLPQFFQDVHDYVYIGEKTAVYKALNMATQYSDFVARYAQYHLMVKKGIDKEKAVKTVRDAFINYNKPNSKFVEWANQMGFMMFTKYFTRIQRAIRDSAETHPLRMLLAVIGQELVTGDIEDITNQSIFTKNLGNLFYSPLENLLGATHPHGAEAVLAVMKGV